MWYPPIVNAVISGDGTGRNSTDENVVAFEFKCPAPNKTFSTDLYYQPPIYYTIQLLSQMAAKNWPEYANVCYGKDSTALLVGRFDEVLWDKLLGVMNTYSLCEKRPTKKPD